MGYYSPLKDRLISNIDTLVTQLRATMSRTPNDLDFSYESLDLISEYVEGIGIEGAQHELYDHLVAYVGEVLRSRIHGRWEIRADHRRHSAPWKSRLVGFHPNQRVSSLHLASDRDVDGIPCASGKDLHVALNFHPNGRLAAAVLARSHVIAGRRYDGGTLVRFDRDGQVIYAQPKATVDRTAREVSQAVAELAMGMRGRLRHHSATAKQ